VAVGGRGAATPAVRGAATGVRGRRRTTPTARVGRARRPVKAAGAAVNAMAVGRLGVWRRGMGRCAEKGGTERKEAADVDSVDAGERG